MYLKNTSNEVKELVIKINELDRDDKQKFILERLGKKWEDTAREYEKKIADKEEQIKILTANLADIAGKNTEALHSKVYVESLEKE